jgi:hypothetical protein
VLPRYRDLWREQLAALESARRGEPVKSTTWKRYDPALVFASFPSARMSADTLLGPGPQFAEWNELPRQAGVAANAPVLMGDSDYRALRDLFADGQARTAAQALANIPAERQGRVFRALHWLVKIGLLRLVWIDANVFEADS